jgi:hypothetical protein
VEADGRAAALDAGAAMINDTSGLADVGLAELCAATGAALVVMHTRAAPKQERFADYGGDVVGDVVAFLRERCDAARAAGVPTTSSCSTRARLRQDAGRDGRGAARDRPRRGARPPLLLAGLAQVLRRRDHGPPPARRRTPPRGRRTPGGIVGPRRRRARLRASRVLAGDEVPASTGTTLMVRGG